MQFPAFWTPAGACPRENGGGDDDFFQGRQQQYNMQRRSHMSRTQSKVIPIVVISLFLAFPAFAANDKQPPTGTADAKGEQPAAFITLKVPVASPLFSHAPVAIVNGEEITLQDLNGALTSSHEGMVDDKKQAARIDYAQILKRMINTRLI